MKKLLITAVALMFGLTLSTTPATAQVDAQIGLGLDYTSQTFDGTIGIKGEGVFGFSDSFRGAVDFTYYFPEVGDLWAFNGNLHYVFFSQATTAVYGLGGINYASSSGFSEVGFNLGAGAEFGVGFGSIFLEPKFVVGNFDGFAGSAGLRFGL